MQKNGNGKAKTIIALVTCVVLVFVTIAGIIFAGSDVKNTANDAEAAVIELKKDGCDPVQVLSGKVIRLETQWEAIGTSQQRIENNQQAILKKLEK